MGSRRENKATRDRRVAGNQPAQTAPMGKEVGYSQGQTNLSAQNEAEGGIPLPVTRPGKQRTVGGAGGTVAASVPPSSAVEQAQGYTPQVTPLNAPDEDPSLDITDGLNRAVMRPEALRNQKIQAAALMQLRRWIDMTGNTSMMMAANDLERRQGGTL